MLTWVLACLLSLTCIHSQAGPILSTDGPVGFFTNAAIRLLLKAGYTVGPPTSTSNLLVTSTASSTPVASLQIPIWPTNFYTPSVHRLLQLAANLYDATTNRTDNGYPTTYPYLPTIFRPVFRSGSGKEGGNQISIIGYQEVTAADTLTLLSSTTPHDLSDPSDDRQVKPLDMVYNIPLVIGAKKGLPNFNEFAAQTAIQVTRKLQFRRNPANIPLPNALNQMFIVGISNQFGFEAWNSYAANFPRQLQVYAYPDFTVTMTNLETKKTLLQSTYRQTQPPTIVPVNAWQGFNYADQYGLSFLIPLSTNILFLTNSTYRSPNFGDQFLPLTGTFEQTTVTNLHVPHWSASVRSRLRFAVVDAGSGRIVDYAILAAQTPLDITDALMHDTPNQYGPGGPGATSFSPQYITTDHPGYLWSTSRLNGLTLDTVPTIGIMSQLDVSFGHPDTPNPAFNSATLDAPPGMSLSDAITFFKGQFTPTFPLHTNVFNAPYQPYRNIYLVNVWQANDPLVHYTLGDLAVARTNLFELDMIQSPTPMSTLGGLSARYEPWGGRPGGGSVVPPYSLPLKDPVAANFGRSDYWDFPTNQSSGASWLGRVHRGTPWQTIYLKEPGTILPFWLPWTANSQLVTNFGQLSTAVVPLNGVIYDASLTQPTNDWRLAAMLVSLLSTNNARQLLSANQTSLPAWEGALDGMVVLTNNEGPDPPEGLTSLVMSSNSPQAATIATAILTTRASQPNQSFQDPGDVLLTPELSVASPWLDTNNVGPYPANITDEAYEAIPSQLLALLRADSVGCIVRAGGTLQIQFSGSDGLAYAVQVSTNLANWASLSTNLPYGGVFTFLDFPPPGAPRRFYRSLLLP